MRNRFLSAFIATIVFFGTGFVLGNMSQDRMETITVKYSNIKIFINGRQIKPDVEPFTYEWRTFVPLRIIAEAFDKEVSWDEQTSSVHINDKILHPNFPRTPLQGYGSIISPLFELAPGAYAFHTSHHGTGLFSVELMDQHGNHIDYLALDFGSFSGSKSLTIKTPSIYYLAIEADGDWKITAMTDILKDEPATPQPTGEIAVHFIDVGQGDATLIITPCEKNILIDAGTKSGGNRVVAYLQALGIDRIDKAIATHEHADHIGGLITLYQSPITVGTTYGSSIEHETNTAREFRELARQHSLFKIPQPLDTLSLDCIDTIATFLHPDPSLNQSINNMSLVLNIDYRDFSILLTGDAEKEAEETMLANPQIRSNLPSQVLKVGHHGSRTSSTQEFLDVVSPEVAVIHLGQGNRYGHPHPETLEKFIARGSTIYRTDTDGNIAIKSDGYTYYVETGFDPSHAMSQNATQQKNGICTFFANVMKFFKSIF